MNKSRENLFSYLKLPEMRPFWFFLPVILIMLLIELRYLSPLFVFISVGLFLVLAAILLANNLKLARLNFQIKLERKQLENIVSNLFDGVIAYDQNFKILLFNRAAEQIFNLRAVEVENQIFTPERAKEAKYFIFCRVLFPSLAPSIVRRSEAGVYPQVVDMLFENPKIELRVTSDRIIDSNGKLLGFTKVILDRTREMEILRAKDEFIEVAAHQLRTPLTSVYWVFESLSKANENLNADQKEMIRMGYMAANNLLKTVNDLLDVAQIEEGRFGYNYEEVDIVNFIENVVTQRMIEAKEYAIKIYLKKPNGDLPQLLIDKKKLTLVLDNLLSNAIKYNVENGEVLVTIEKLNNKPFVQISIRDTGIGISPQDIKKLFSKFFRADSAQKSVANGTGLGLYIAKNIVERHGGEIWAESQLNRGTTFYFTLPTDHQMIPTLRLTNNQ